MTEKLNLKQQLFIEEYLVDLNGTQAAIRAGYAPKSAATTAAKLLKTPAIKDAIKTQQEKLTDEIGITQKEVLQQLINIAHSDPNEISELRRVPCRFCYGKNHLYQWRTKREFQDAYDKAVAQDLAVLPNNKGGFGYTVKKDPNPKCPECDGYGIERLYLNDTRKLSTGAKSLLKRARITKDGLEIEIHDQMSALTNLAKHLGMFTEKIDINSHVKDDVLEQLAVIEERNRQQSLLLAQKIEERNEE